MSKSITRGWAFGAATILLLASMSGCETMPMRHPGAMAAPIMHIVFITLHDPAQAETLIHDSDVMLASIPSVKFYACGRHVETGRANVDQAYDVGLVIGFATPEGYAAYVEHQNHVELVNRWKPAISSMLVRDVLDQE